MTKKNEICVSSNVVGNAINGIVKPSKNLSKYFNSLNLYVNYDSSLSADESILNIPIVSTVLPLAWLTGADVYVNSLDKRYVTAMNAIKDEFRLIFPRVKFTTKIIVDDLVENETGSQETALLFSGGLDSTYSFLRNIGLKPRLIMYWGVNHYQLNSSYEKHKQLIKEVYSDLANREGLILNFIETNASNVLGDDRISHDFSKVLRGANVYPSLRLSLFLLGLLAPFSIGRFNEVIIAATLDSKHDYLKHPYGSQPNIDEKFAWANLKVIHDGYIQRFRKTTEISDYLKKNPLQLKVCNRPPYDKLNCSACEKCYGTILSLILQEINPNKCGFDVNNLTLKSVKAMFEDKKLDGYEMAGDLEYWRVLQDMIPNELNYDSYGSKEFFEWFRNYDVVQLSQFNNSRIAFGNRLISSLPFPVATRILKMLIAIKKR